MITNENLKGKNVFMTGSTSGFGKIAAWEMAQKGANVITTFRSREKADMLLADYEKNYPKGPGSIEFVQCDLNSLKSISEACEEIKRKYDGLDMIVNNAGVMNLKFRESQDGIEQTLQVNLLAPTLFIHELSALLDGADDPRIINTASALHQGVIQFDDPEFRNNFRGMDAYRQSKLGLILLGRHMSIQKAHLNVKVFSVHPGVIRTELGRDFNFFIRGIFWLMGKGIKKGAETLLHLVESPIENLVPGEYYANKKVASSTPESHDLKMAEGLMPVLQKYLQPHLKGSSILFDNNG